MINCIAIDDEINALGVIQEFVKRINDVVLEQVFTDPTKALKYITETKPQVDLVFLDIQMSRLNGLSLAQYLPKSAHIVITTAYPDFALQGYEMDVVDYLLKPFSFERFERSVQKVRSIVMLKGKEPLPNSIYNRLMPGADDFIFVRSGYKTLKVKLAEIRYIEGSGNYVTLHTSTEKILVLQNMKTFETQLEPYQFVRIHKSFIIALNHIDTFEKNWVQINKKDIPIGESYKESFQLFLKENYKQF